MDSGSRKSETMPLATTNSSLELFKAMSHPVRLQICQLLALKQHSVGNICRLLNMKQYAVSQQLSLLRKAEIVGTRRSGRNVIYFLNNKKILAILDACVSKPLELRKKTVHVESSIKKEPESYRDRH